MSEEPTEPIQEEEVRTPLAEFLESVPPGSVTAVSDLAVICYWDSGQYRAHTFATPDIQLHCGSDSCNRTLFFRHVRGSPSDLSRNDWKFFYITYRCSNCQETEKCFSLAAHLTGDGVDGQCYKFGEMPEYGPPAPARLIKLIGPDRDLFLKGRRCENQGLGIGAFGYYRRVVEHQKNRILDEILAVARKLDATPTAIAELEAAKAETQFSKALGSVKASIPQSLLINGHNPLGLLHAALSDGLHERTDGECLELASSVRVVLAELSERLAQAMKDEAELNRALGKLMGVKGK